MNCIEEQYVKTSSVRAAKEIILDSFLLISCTSSCQFLCFLINLVSALAFPLRTLAPNTHLPPLPVTLQLGKPGLITKGGGLCVICLIQRCMGQEMVLHFQLRSGNWGIFPSEDMLGFSICVVLGSGVRVSHRLCSTKSPIS